MKVLTGAVLALLFALAHPPIANVAEIEQFGFLGAFVGAERETGQPNAHGVGRAGPRSTIEALGMLPFAWQNFGLQGSASLVGGSGARFGASVGPVFGWPGGKSGIFFDYQHRALRGSDHFWISPAIAVYLNQFNLNLKYSHPLSGAQKHFQGDPSDVNQIDQAMNRLQATVSYFPPMDLFFIRRDNAEFTFGVQVNNFAGVDRTEMRSAGVGPIFGAAVMPWQNLEVNLFRVTVDNRSRYQFNTGLRYFFNAAGTGQSLLQVRRKYLDAGPGPVGSYTASHKS
jgi:hypothetical protein